MQKKLTARQERQAVVYQFELQAVKLGMQIRQRLTNYRFLLHDAYREKEITGMALASSFDFYEYRLNKAAHRVDLLIVQRHNAVVSLRVVELETGCEYEPGAVPPGIERQERSKRNHEEVKLLVSKLLVGLDGAYDELADMPKRTRQRYLALRDEYLKPRVGRPWAS